MFSLLKPILEDSQKKDIVLPLIGFGPKLETFTGCKKELMLWSDNMLLPNSLNVTHWNNHWVHGNKNESSKAHHEKLQKWHSTMQGRLTQTGTSSPSNDPKWGYFKFSQRFNVDQSPLPFTNEVNKT